MKFLKRTRNKIITMNRDVLAVYRIKIYCSRSVLMSFRVVRYSLLLILLCRKYILRQNILTDRQQMKRTLCLEREGSLAKRPGLPGKAKMVMERDVILFDVTQILLSRVADSNAEVRTYEVNPYGRLLFDIAVQNNKKVILIWNGTKQEQETVEKILAEHDYADYQELVFCNDRPDVRRAYIIEYLETSYSEKSSFYLGSYIKPLPGSSLVRRSVSVYHECSFWGGVFRPDAGDNLHISIYNHLLNNKFHSGMMKYSRSYELGYTYVGMISLYIFMQKKIRKTSFAEEYQRFQEMVKGSIKAKNHELVERLCYITFPPFLNNPVYDGSEMRDYSGLTLEQEIEKYITIQNAAAEFMNDYETRIYTYSEDYVISETDIMIILKFLLLDAKRASTYLEF